MKDDGVSESGVRGLTDEKEGGKTKEEGLCEVWSHESGVRSPVTPKHHNP